MSHRSLDQQYPRIYAALKAQGHSAAKAVEILLDAKRQVSHAKQWIRICAYAARKAVRS
jgi:hypothetical protein